jgi:serine-type D-Ala-D-Ala endopeptidase (penicillin-binding protein 7)
MNKHKKFILPPRFFGAAFLAVVVIAISLLVGESPLVAHTGLGDSEIASLSVPTIVHAAVPSGPQRIHEQAFPEVTAASAVVVDAVTGHILGDKNKEYVGPIASITKVMTALVFLDYNTSWDTLKMQRSDYRPGGTILVRAGSQMTQYDAFMTMLVGSENNVAIALTRSLGFTEQDFVTRMNQYAEQLDLADTHFVDPTGLKSGNISTALDLVRLGWHVFQQPSMREALTTPEYYFTATNTRVRHHIRTTNDLLTAEIDGYSIIAAKTGFTNDAGYTFLVEAANQDGERVIVAVLDAPTETDRFRDADALIRWAFETYDW